MKNLPIILLLALMIMPFAFAGFYTDTSRNYFTQKCYSGGVGNCFSEDGYMLNNYIDTYIERQYNIQNPNNVDSRIEYNSTDWDSCNLVLGGSEFRGLPFSFKDAYTNYSFSSFIRLKNFGNASYIEQINSKCQVFDSLGSENTSIVSQLGIINKGSANGILPMFAYAYNNTGDGNVYMRVYTLKSDINILSFLGDFFIGDWEEFGDYNNNYGVTGGSYYSDNNNPTAAERVFGLFSNNFNEMFILYGTNSYPYFSHSEIIDIPYFQDNYSTNHQLFFDDWDADGNNEFILLGASPELTPIRSMFSLNRILPFSSPPYYYVYNEVNFTPAYLVNPGDMGTPRNYKDGTITICQIGYIDSPLEACVSGDNRDDNARNYASVINIHRII
jgi:hypothetical protein